MAAVTELSPRYYMAEASVWLIGAVVLLSKFVGLAPTQSVPILNVTLEQSQHLPRVVGALFIASLVYLLFEWKQSPVEARVSGWIRVRVSASALWAVGILWLLFDVLAQGTDFASISPGWLVAFVLIGCASGILTDLLILAAQLVRSGKEAARVRLPRVPAAAHAQFVSWGPVLAVLLVVYQVLIHLAPGPVRTVAPALTGLPLLMFLIAGAINNRKALPGVRHATDAHDYAYKLHREQPSFAATEKAAESNLQRPSEQPEFRFRSQLEAEIAFKFMKNGVECALDESAPDAISIDRSLYKDGGIPVTVQVEGMEKAPRKLILSVDDVEAGASAYLRSSRGGATLETRALLSNALNQATLLAMERQAGPPLVRAARHGLEPELLAALKSDIDVNERSQGGWTALLYACAENHPKVVRHLLEAGANPDLPNWLGRTPLQFAAGYGNEEVCALLIEYGANLNLTDERGDTALMVAISRGRPATAEMLIVAGADIGIKNKHHQSALDLAHLNKQGAVAKSLRQAAKSKAL